MLEGDLAFHGIDLRDLWRPGSTLTPRRLLVLIRALPRATHFSPGALLWRVLDAETATTLKPTPDQIRARQAHYEGG